MAPGTDVCEPNLQWPFCALRGKKGLGVRLFILGPQGIGVMENRMETTAIMWAPKVLETMTSGNTLLVGSPKALLCSLPLRMRLTKDTSLLQLCGGYPKER